MSDDLAEFLLARIAEDEQLARMATPGSWHAVEMYPDCHYIEARWDPVRVLAECKAKRLVIDVCQDRSAIHWGLASWLLSLLALPYADHPDYRQKWQALADS